MIDFVGRARQAIEVFTQDLARQKNRIDAKTPTLNLSRNEVLISLVLFGLADEPDWYLVDVTARSEGSILGYKDFRAHRIRYGNRKCNLVSDGDVRSKNAGQQKSCLIWKYARGGIRLALDAYHTLAVYRNGRAGKCKSHAVGGQYRTVLRKCKTPLRILNQSFRSLSWL